MDRFEKKRITDIARKYLGQKMEFGVNDCNLLFSEIYAPEVHEALKGSYTDPEDGMRLCKHLFGFSSVKKYMTQEGWQVKQHGFASFGDVFLHGSDLMLCMGAKTLLIKDGVYVLADTRRLPTSLNPRGRT